MANPRQDREQRQLLCKLTEDELRKRGDEMAMCELTIDDLKERRRGINGEIADHAAKRNKLAQIIDEGMEQRAVDCTWIEDLKQNCADLIRQDTGEKVDTRPLTADDLQTGFELEETPEGEVRPKTANTRHAHA